MRPSRLVPRITFLLSLLVASCDDSSPPSTAPEGGGNGGEPGSGGSSGSASGGAPASGGSSGSGGNSRSGGSPGSGGSPATGGTGSAPDGGSWDSRAITTRPTRDTYSCKIERDRTVHTPRNWSVAGRDLVVTTGGDVFFARFESTGPSPFQQGPVKFVVGKLGVDGAFGSTVEPSTAPIDSLSAPAMAPRGDGFALIWVEGASLRFAAFDAAGAVVVPPKSIPGGAVDSLSDPHIVRGSGTDFGVVYATASEGGEDADVRFLVLDGEGNTKGTSKLVRSLTATGYLPVTGAVADGDGYALLYRDVENQRGQVYFAARDASGEERVAPKRLSTIDAEGVSSGVGAGFDRSGLALLKVGAGFLAAWTETRQGADFMSGASSIIRVAKVARDGTLEHHPVAVREIETDIDEVEPTLSAFGDAVALQWARGSHIYICAGCMPDHRVDLLLIDPETLDPLSPLVSMKKRTDPGGGLMTRDTVVAGKNLLMTFDQQYHVSADPASGAFSCTGK